VDIPYRIDFPINIETCKLLYWPNNPRLKISNFDEVKFTEDQLLDSGNQEKIFRLLTKEEHHDVNKLVTSMQQSGFMQQKAPIVMKVNGANRYLVLEGNRRLAAIRTVLSSSRSKISKKNAKTLQSIPCWRFVHTARDTPLELAISRMVAEEHIKGQKPHSKLQQAHMIYSAYEGILYELNRTKRFRKDQRAITHTAELFDLNRNEIETAVAVVRFYKQLSSAGYEVPHSAREKLSWISQFPGLFGQHFDYEASTYSLSDEGLERFYDLFIAENAAVKNPATFKKFRVVMKEGDPTDLETIRSEPDALDIIVSRIRNDKADNAFLLNLRAIEKKIEELRVSSCNGSSEEADSIKRISDLVEKRLKRLLDNGVISASSEANNQSNSSNSSPQSIDDVMLIERDRLLIEMLRIIKNQPNGTCVTSMVPTILLQTWDVSTHGRSLARFEQHVSQLTESLLDSGILVHKPSINSTVCLA
jgi:hypothetical protein